jgi:adenosylcobinamide-phosphate synthase
MALSLDVALSGPRSYDGKPETFPWVNAPGRTALGVGDIHQTCTALWKSWAALLALLQVFIVLHALSV